MDDPQLKIVDVSFGHEAVGVPLPNLSTPGALESLPKQQQQVLRIYTGYGLWQNECFQDHIQKSFQSSLRFVPRVVDCSDDFSGLLSACRNGIETPNKTFQQWTITTYVFRSRMWTFDVETANTSLCFGIDTEGNTKCMI
jgi:hypothetical protein